MDLSSINIPALQGALLRRSCTAYYIPVWRCVTVYSVLVCVYCALECVPMYIFCARVCLLCVGVYSNVFCARVWAWVELEQHWVRIIWVEIRDGG